MPGKKPTPKVSTNKVKDLTQMDEDNIASPREEVAEPSTSDQIKLEQALTELAEIKTTLAEVKSIVLSTNAALTSKPSDVTKVASAARPKIETSFNWFKSRLQKDDVLFMAIMKGENPEIWDFGEYKTKFKEHCKNIVHSDIEEVRKKAARALWMNCFGDKEKEAIKTYREKVDPPEKPTRSKKPKVSLFSDEEDANTVEPKPAPKKAASKPGAKKAASKPASKPAAKRGSSKPPEEEPPQPKALDLDDDSDSHVDLNDSGDD